MRAPSGRGSAIQPLESFPFRIGPNSLLAMLPLGLRSGRRTIFQIPIGLAGCSERWYQRNCFVNHASLS